MGFRADEIQIKTSDQFEQLRQLMEDRLAPPSPVAYSIDGRIFGYEAPLSPPLSVGCYVILQSKSGRKYLGQIISREMSVRSGPEYGIKIDADSFVVAKSAASAHFIDRVQIRSIQGFGVILGRYSDRADPSLTRVTEKDTFQNAKISKASEEVVAQYLKSVSDGQAVLEIGKAQHANETARVLLKADGFKRHTFLCGQSGSGKTFALGVILEQLLLETGLRVVILDPNSDFVSLDQIRQIAGVNSTRSLDIFPEDYDKIATRYAEIKPSIRIVRPMGYAEDQYTLRVRFSDLEPDEQAAVLKLHPLEDREEFGRFRDIIERLEQKDYSLSDIKATISYKWDGELGHRIELRIENLGIEGWEIWCPSGESSLADQLQGDWRCMVIDLGTLPSPDQKSVAAMAVFGHFWRDRHQKDPVLIVIDEAHNICSQHPSTDLNAIATDYVGRIAGEGRKFGIYLLLATQRPAKIHSNALSECDNTILMRVNSRSDLAYIAETFSQLPTDLLNQCSVFGLGESLLAGKIVHSPTFAKFEGRLSHEGGGDVTASWAVKRSSLE